MVAHGFALKFLYRYVVVERLGRLTDYSWIIFSILSRWPPKSRIATENSSSDQYQEIVVEVGEGGVIVRQINADTSCRFPLASRQFVFPFLFYCCSHPCPCTTRQTTSMQDRTQLFLAIHFPTQRSRIKQRC